MSLGIFLTKPGIPLALNFVQFKSGLEPCDWKVMQSVGPDVKENRIHVSGKWHVIYIANLADAVLEVFYEPAYSQFVQECFCRPWVFSRRSSNSSNAR
jgi:hypothetical protein